VSRGGIFALFRQAKRRKNRKKSNRRLWVCKRL